MAPVTEFLSKLRRPLIGSGLNTYTVCREHISERGDVDWAETPNQELLLCMGVKLWYHSDRNLIAIYDMSR
ncbi:hypothetical protein MAE02_38340 [Microvirga aerophila]|uniref:Uncharacterized protein n=1 Tax=Microvirga aerophila TaxID=670291 RepID=A0A512BW03_9HYPH|nr:hypothetical protein MAE02_38340 [Microvirga aerophila]